jgi:transposase
LGSTCRPAAGIADRSERLDPDQLQLGLEGLEQTVAAAEAAQEAASRSSAAPRPPRWRRRNLGALPAHLPRVEVLADVEDKTCPCCGGALHVIGESREEMLDIVPAQLRVRVIRRPRYSCRACEEAVVQAPAPERPITGGMATEALLAHVLVAKYADFLPLHRQAQIFARQGIELDRSTLCDWVGRSCWWLEPLWRLLHRHVMGSTRIFADDTPLPVLDPGRGRTKTGRLWGCAVDDRPWDGETPPAVVYLYAADRKGARPAAHLAGFRGVLQVDGYSGFKGLLANRPPGAIRLAFCWAHCRRRFYEIHQATGSPLAQGALRRISALYGIEAEIRSRSAEERLVARQERSEPIVAALHAWLVAQLERVSGKSALAEAIRYALRHWTGLVLFLEDGRLELDTNTVERAIRMHESLYRSFLTVWKHWKGVLIGDATWATRSGNRRCHGIGLEIRCSDLEGRARHDLSGGEDLSLDETANGVIRHAKRLGSLGHGQPCAPLVRRPIGVNVPDTAHRADPLRRPRLALAGRDAHPVERRRNMLVRPPPGHAPHHRQGVFRRRATVLAGPRLAHAQL